MAKGDFQSRLAEKLEPMARKCLDNKLELEGSITDAIRVTLTQNREKDEVSTTLKKADVISVIFPDLKDVPFVRLDDDSVKLDALVTDPTEEKYEVYTPYTAKVAIGDIILKTMVDPENTDVYVIPMQVSNVLGNFGKQMLIYQKTVCTIYTKPLPAKILKTVKQVALRRLQIKY